VAPRMYRAKCLRDTVQDNPYQYFRAGEEYMIPEDSPVALHFQPLEQLSPKESAKVIEEIKESAPQEDKDPATLAYSKPVRKTVRK